MIVLWFYSTAAHRMSLKLRQRCFLYQTGSWGNVSSRHHHLCELRVCQQLLLSVYPCKLDHIRLKINRLVRPIFQRTFHLSSSYFPHSSPLFHLERSAAVKLALRGSLLIISWREALLKWVTLSSRLRNSFLGGHMRAEARLKQHRRWGAQVRAAGIERTPFCWRRTLNFSLDLQVSIFLLSGMGLL